MIPDRGTALVFLGGLIVLGGLVGGLTGWLFTRLLRRPPLWSPALDIVAGVLAFLVVQALAVSASSHASYVDGRAVGWQGVILHYQLIFRFSTAVAFVAVLHALRAALAPHQGAA